MNTPAPTRHTVSPGTTSDVLVIDDHRVFTDLLRLALGQEADLRCVAVAHSAAEGLASAAAVPFSVAIVDLQLPDAGGLEVVARLAATAPAARVVVLTAHPRADLAQRALAAGAVGFLGKGAPLATILHAVRSARPGHPVLDESVRAVAGCGVRLTPREHDVLRELGRGRDATRAASALGISVATTRGHIKAVMAKLGVHSQLHAVVSAERLGLITLGSRY